MTPAETRSVAIGAELHRLNATRARRARLLGSVYWDRVPPSAQARFLCDLAQIDQARRELRELLRDQLGEVDAQTAYAIKAGYGAAVPPRSDPHPYRGRHAAP